MAEYLRFDRTTIDDFSDVNIETMYQKGYVFTRVGKGVMDQTRSVRIHLRSFKLSSENRQILRKMENLKMTTRELPFESYSWEIGKLAKDFYEEKFGPKTFSANKVKEMLTDAENSNFNQLVQYAVIDQPIRSGVFGMIDTIPEGKTPDGYAIVCETEQLIHYSYPFYDLNTDVKNLGMAMMLRAIQWAENSGKVYIYLGSAQRPSDRYKLQFEGLEWFDGEGWSRNIELLKQVLK